MSVKLRLNEKIRFIKNIDRTQSYLAMIYLYNYFNYIYDYWSIWNVLDNLCVSSTMYVFQIVISKFTINILISENLPGITYSIILLFSRAKKNCPCSMQIQNNFEMVHIYIITLIIFGTIALTWTKSQIKYTCVVDRIHELSCKSMFILDVFR